MSHARLSRYMTAANGDIKQALQLYEWNLACSEALFGFLHGLEVALRNSLHHVLSNDIGRPDWFREGHPLPWRSPSSLHFTDAMNSMISDARTNAGGLAAPVGKVIAELPFGFWVSLTTGRFDELWRVSLHRAFPQVTVARRIVHWRLEVIRRLRNRIAHHEPILTSRKEVYTGFADQTTISLPAIMECVGWVSTATAEWLRSSTRYEQGDALLTEVHASGVVL
jgi:Abi-like protein